MARKKLLLLTALCFLTYVSGAASFASETAACYEPDPDGTCLDDKSPPPRTGQYNNSSDQQGATTPTGLRSTAAHANVRLSEATYVLAHNICRFVDNPGSRGRAIFVGLEDKTEWTSFIAAPPSGVALQYCCQPVTVSICGASVTVPFEVAGKSHSYAGGYNFRATYTCGAGTGTVGPTLDTAWTVATSGSCAAPTTDTGCTVNLHVSADCQTSDDNTGYQHEGGGAGDNGSGKGPGGNNPSKGYSGD